MMDTFSDLVEQVQPSQIREFFELVIAADNVISLGVGEPDFLTPWSVRHAAIQSLVQGKTTYTSNKGLLEARQAISDYMATKFGVRYDAETEVLLTLGVSEGIDLSFRTLLNPGDEVIVPEPCFVCYGPLVTLARGEKVALDTSSTGFIPDPAALKEKITPKTKALLLCSPSNPTGRVIPKETLTAILELTQKHGIWVLSDEIYAELIYDTVFTSAGSLSKDRVIVLNGFSKAFAMTGWRLGFLGGPAAFVERALKIHQYTMMCAPTTSQYAAMAALEDADGQVEAMRASYHERRDFFVGAMNDMGLTTLMPEGAFYCFPNITATGKTSQEFAFELLKAQSVAVIPGTAFGAGGEGHIRCCYATSRAELETALEKIKQFIA